MDGRLAELRERILRAPPPGPGAKPLFHLRLSAHPRPFSSILFL
jgi:hypothetical protein